MTVTVQSFSNEQALKLIHFLTLALVQETRPDGMEDFTLRQLAILLTVYRESPPHTVRGLAARLHVSKPVITRALDAIGKQSLISRRRDENDLRNVIIQRTVKGVLYVEKLTDKTMEIIGKFQEVPA